MKKHIVISLIAFIAASVGALADNMSQEKPDTLILSEPVVEDSLVVKDNFLPVSRRVDRGINTITYVYKKEVALGLDVSYGALSSDDTNLMLFLDDFNFSGSVFTINPSVGYFIKDNLCIGARVGYSRVYGNLGNIALDLGSDDMTFSLSDVVVSSNMTNMGVYMRSYAGLDPRGVFGLFAEIELSYKLGNTLFSYTSSSGTSSTNSFNSQARLGLSGGLSVFIMPRVCANLSLGFGGLSYNRIRQQDATGAATGGRETARMNWKLNLLDIGIGFNIHL